MNEHVEVLFGNSLKINRPDYVLSKTEDLTEAAATLFSILHKADEQKQNSIEHSQFCVCNTYKKLQKNDSFVIFCMCQFWMLC